MAGHCKAEIVSAVKAAFDNKQLPDLENDAMAFMMSKSAYLYDEGDHNGPHLMFFTALKDGKDWGAFASGSPVVSGPYWFLSSKEPPQAKGLSPILVFAVEVAEWSDGAAAPMHRDIPLSSGMATRQRAQPWECTPVTTRSFILTLARLRRRREAFLNPRLPERCLAGDGPGRLIAVEVEI
jgi:hypothetical protein